MLERKRYEDAHNSTMNCESDYFKKGLLYYSDEKRSSLLDQAERLCYSRLAIARLKMFTDENWNPDNVSIEDIREFAAIENYVKKNTPAWKKSVFSQIGSFINGAE